MSTNGFREMLREVRDYERRMGFGEPTALTEGRADDHVGIVDGKIVVNRTRAQEQVLQEAINKLREESREIPDDIHARLACAIDGTRLLGAPPLAEARALDETKKRAAVAEIPEGTHQKLAEALGDGPLAPEGYHERLARAVGR